MSEWSNITPEYLSGLSNIVACKCNVSKRGRVVRRHRMYQRALTPPTVPQKCHLEPYQATLSGSGAPLFTLVRYPYGCARLPKCGTLIPKIASDHSTTYSEEPALLWTEALLPVLCSGIWRLMNHFCWSRGGLEGLVNTLVRPQGLCRGALSLMRTNYLCEHKLLWNLPV